MKRPFLFLALCLLAKTYALSTQVNQFVEDKEPEKRDVPQQIIIPVQPVHAISFVGVNALNPINSVRPTTQNLQFYTVYEDYAAYIDGVKIIGEVNIPKSAIDYYVVMERGIPAEYGDFSFGRINRNGEGYSFLTAEY